MGRQQALLIVKKDRWGRILTEENTSVHVFLVHIYYLCVCVVSVSLPLCSVAVVLVRGGGNCIKYPGHAESCALPAKTKPPELFYS